MICVTFRTNKLGLWVRGNWGQRKTGKVESQENRRKRVKEEERAES